MFEIIQFEANFFIFFFYRGQVVARHSIDNSINNWFIWGLKYFLFYCKLSVISHHVFCFVVMCLPNIKFVKFFSLQSLTFLHSLLFLMELSSWSYGSWIYNYLWNQWLSPLTLWVRTPLRRGVLDTTLCDKVCQWLAIGRWFSSTNKTNCHDITEILLKVALYTRIGLHKPQLNLSVN